MKRVIVLLITLALLVGMVGCPADPEPTPPVEYSLTISGTEGGSVTSPGEGTFTYDEGTSVNLVAVPASGYSFGGWTGHVSTIANVNAASTTITMNGDYSITANFRMIPIAKYNLTVSSTEGGSVTAPGDGTFTYDAGAVVDLVAEAEEGYQFAYWTGSVGAIGDVNAASTTVTMTGDHTITANFAKGIRTWYDLDAIRDDLSGDYLLMNDLDSNTIGYQKLASPAANDGRGWQPIGTIHYPFAGSLDGQDYEIEALFIERPTERHVGLLGVVDKTGTIANLGLAETTVIGGADVGGLAGISRGAVSNSSSHGVVTGRWGVGGLVGTSTGILSSTCSACSVIGEQFVGGLVGYNWGTVINSCSGSSVRGFGEVGGLVGRNHLGTVNNSYSSGSVTGGGAVGGLVGNNAMGAVRNCYATSSVAGGQDIGGLIGANTGDLVAYSYSAGSVTGDVYVGGLIGRNTPTHHFPDPAVTACLWDSEAAGCEESDGGSGRTTAQMQDVLTFSRIWWDIAVVAPGETNPAYTWNIVDGQTYPFLSWQQAP